MIISPHFSLNEDSAVCRYTHNNKNNNVGNTNNDLINYGFYLKGK